LSPGPRNGRSLRGYTILGPGGIFTFKKLTNEVIDARILGRSLIRIGSYINYDTPIKWLCLVDGCEWSATPNNIVNNHGCPKCGGNLRLTNEVIDIRLKDSNRDIERIGNYINKTTKIKWKCLKDEHIWETEPRNILIRKNGCPICKASRCEQQIKSFLINNNIEYIHNYKFENCRHINKLPFDFYLPHHNLCIEFDGEQHYKSIAHFGGDKKLLSRQKIDAIKTNFCKESGINLLRIPYWDAGELLKILEENIIAPGIIEKETI
jgi:very-short-patch-repair endonuclease